MAFRTRALSRYATSDRTRQGRSNAYVYSTDDAAADVLAAGYFTAAANRFGLKPGDLIDCTAAVGGTPAMLKLVIASVVAGVVSVAEAGGGVVAPTLGLARAADGSVGQVYTASAAGQWVTRTSAGVVAEISGQTGATYTAVAGDAGKTIGVRNTAGVVTWSAGPVLTAPVLLNAADSLTGQTALGASTTLSLRTDRKVQGAAAVQADIVASTALGGVDFTTTETYDPATLGVIVASVDRLTEGAVTGHQLFVNMGATGGNVLLQNDALQLPGARFIGFDQSEISGLAGPAAVRTRVGFNKGTTVAVSAIVDAVMARAGGRPTVLLSFDDGYKSIRDVAYGELSSRGLKATVYPAPSLLNQGSGEFTFMTTADIQFLHAAGWDIGCDGTMNDAAVSTDPATAVADLQQVKAWVDANVGDRASSFACWPFGNHQSDAVAEAVLTAGFKAVRGTQLPGYHHSRFNPGRAYRKKFPSQGIGSATVPADILALVDLAIKRGMTVSLHMHHFTEATGNSIYIPSSVRTPILDGLASRRDAYSLDVMTVSEWWARDGGASVPV